MFWEQKLLPISTCMEDRKCTSKQVNPFTLKQIRGCDFGRQVLQAKYLPNCRKHILHVCMEGIVVLDHLTGHYTLVREELGWNTFFVMEKPNRCKSWTRMWFICNIARFVTEYRIQNTRLDRNESGQAIGKKSRLV